MRPIGDAYVVSDPRSGRSVFVGLPQNPDRLDSETKAAATAMGFLPGIGWSASLIIPTWNAGGNALLGHTSDAKAAGVDLLKKSALIALDCAAFAITPYALVASMAVRAAVLALELRAGARGSATAPRRPPDDALSTQPVAGLGIAAVTRHATADLSDAGHHQVAPMREDRLSVRDRREVRGQVSLAQRGGSHEEHVRTRVGRSRGREEGRAL